MALEDWADHQRVGVVVVQNPLQDVAFSILGPRATPNQRFMGLRGYILMAGLLVVLIVPQLAL